MKAATPRDPIRAAMIDALYGNIANQTLGGIATSAFLAASALLYNEVAPILAWLACQALLQGGRLLLLLRYQARPPRGSVEPWARLYLGYIILQGLLWGSTMWLFVHDGEPLSVALTLSCLYAVVCGSIPSNAYQPSSSNALMLLIFGSVVIRMVSTGQLAYLLVGIASFFFLLVVFSIARTQHRVLREGFRIRFENAELLEQLRVKTETAEQANLAKSQFLAAASHDLRQPLYALSLFSASLEELKLDKSGRDVVRRIQDSIGVMEETFEGLLDLSKLEAGVVRPRLAPVDVDALFDQISQVFRPLALERGLDLRFRSDGQWVLSDATLLGQVLGNLTSNAIRATNSGGVLIAARRRHFMLRFEIYDTGRGIAPEDVERIFDDYVQLDNPERDRRRGMGLGLAIARRSIALLDARIDVASRPGRGSRFGFAQPLSAYEAQARAAAPELKTLRTGTGPVMLVEDDENVRLALCDLFRRWDVDFVAEANPEAGLARLRGKGRFSLLVTDQRLSGGMTGLDLIRAMRSEVPEPPPAIIVTGEMDSPLLSDAKASGIVILHKPVQTEQLRRLLGLTATIDVLPTA